MLSSAWGAYDVRGIGTTTGDRVSNHATATCCGETSRDTAMSATTGSTAVPCEDVRRVRDERNALRLRRAQHILGSAPTDVVGVLHRGHLTEGLRLLQVLEGNVRHTDVAHLALSLQICECAHRLRVRHVGIGHMHLIEVDAIDPQSLQALLAFLTNVLGSTEWRE